MEKLKLLTPVTLSGVVVPWEKRIGPTGASHYKLVCHNGLEYFFVTESEWQNVLSLYRWEEVKVVGLLNMSNKTIIPRKIFPKGPKGEKEEKVIDLAMWQGRNAIRKMSKNVSDLVLIPAALWSEAKYQHL